MLFALEVNGELERAVAEQAGRLVKELREQGVSWQQIADAYGVSVSVARRRFGARPSSQ